MKTKNILLLLVLASLWGPSFLFIKVAVAEIPPISLAALRTGIAALLLIIFLYAKGGKLTKSLKFWGQVTIAGFFAHALPFILINWGEMHIDSGLASILNGLTPLFTIVIANFMVEDDKMSLQKFLGVLVGFIGLFVLVSPSLSLNVKATTLGIAAVSIGAASYGLAMVYSRKHLKSAPPLHAPTAQLLVCTIYLVPLSLMVDGVYPLVEVSAGALWSIFILASFGTALAFVVYYKIIETANASYLSLVTYLMPIYGIILGTAFLNEAFSWHMFMGTALIISGVMVANKPIKVRSGNLKSGHA